MNKSKEAESTEVNNTTYIIPYPIGTYIESKADLIDIARIEKYIIESNGIKVLLALDVCREHSEVHKIICLGELIEKWEQIAEQTIIEEKIEFNMNILLRELASKAYNIYGTKQLGQIRTKKS